MKLLYVMPFKVDVSRWNATGDCNIAQSVLKGYPKDWEIDVVGNFSSLVDNEDLLIAFKDAYNIKNIYDVSRYTPFRNYATKSFMYLDSLGIFKNYDLIQIHYSNPNIINLVNKYMDEYPVIFTIHSPPDVPTFAYFSRDAYYHFIERPNAMLIGVSNSNTERVTTALKYYKTYPDGKPNLTTIVNGIKPNRLPYTPVYDIGTIGRPSKSKSVLESLMCVAAITQHTGGKGFYVGTTSIYEGDDPKEVEYREKVLKLLEDNPQIDWFEYRTSEEISELLASSKCYISLSSIETFGLTVCEAGMQGTPCIGIDKNGIGEIIKEGVTGYKLEPSGSRWTTKVQKAVELYDKCILLDRDVIHEDTKGRFSESRMIKEYQALINTMLNKE